MDEDIILRMVTRCLQENRLSYSDFEDIFSMLSLREQYAVLEILYKNNIELYENEDKSENLEEETESADQKDEFELLYDEGIFSDDYEGDDGERAFEREKDKPVFLKNRDVIHLSNRTLVKMIQEGDAQAKQDLCIKNQRLVDKCANVYYRLLGNKMEFEDLQQIGMMGMIKAAEKFDLSQETEFSTYAVYWIKQMIKREIMDCGYTVRIPVHKMEQIQKVVRLDSQFSQEENYSKRIQMISEESKLHVSIVEDCLRLYYQFIGSTSLDMPVGEDGDVTVGEMMPYEDQPSVEDMVIKTELKSKINEVLSTLREKEREIIIKRFGFDDGRIKTLEEVAQTYGVTRERIRQIEAKALRKLKHISRRKKLQDYFE